MTNLTDKTNFDFDEFKQEAIKKMKAGKPLTGDGGILTPILKDIIEASLEGEIEHHMEVCDANGKNNRRNEKTSKTVQTGSGPIELEMPRDRAGSFEPEIVKKRQTILNESLDNKLIALYGLGMSYQDIRQHMTDKCIFS